MYLNEKLVIEEGIWDFKFHWYPTFKTTISFSLAKKLWVLKLITQQMGIKTLNNNNNIGPGTRMQYFKLRMYLKNLGYFQ